MSLQHPDRLITGTLRSPMLDEFMGSQQLRAEVLAIAEEIRQRHLARLPVETGNLRGTAHVKAVRSTDHPDRRWEGDYEIGGPRADYILPLEEEGHYLQQALRDMGFNVGDGSAQGPTGRLPQGIERGPSTRG